MDGLPRSRRVRSVGTRASTSATSGHCSCDLLQKLAQRSPCGPILAAHGVDAAALQTAQQSMHVEMAPEPADWHLRLAQRGASSSDVEQLLAIARSAESHGYQLLQRVGVESSDLRRSIIEHLRQHGPAGVGTVCAGPPRRTPRPRPGGEPTPSNRAWRSRRERGQRGDSDDDPRTTSRSASAEDSERPSSRPYTARRKPVAPPQATSPAPRTDPDPDAGAPQARDSVAPTHEHTLRAVDRATLPPLHGRDAIVEQLADALLRHAPRPPVLVGPPGSGRSLVAQHLARIIDAPVFMLQATAYDDEEMLGYELDAIAKAGGVAVLDDLDRVPSDAVPPFFSALARAWSRRQPPVLTIASPESYSRLDLWLPGGTASVDRIALPPLPRDQVSDAMSAAAPRLLAGHGLTLAPDAKLGELLRFADRYLSGLAMPGRALDLLDLCCARVVRQGGDVVTRDTWLDITAERSGLPRARIEAQGDQLLLELEQRVAARVVGHDSVCTTLAGLIRRNRAGFGSHRPVLSTLLLGPSGVGKTEIAKALGEALYERPDALIRLDMSEYSEPHAVARVVGAPPGYVGHEQGGALTDPLRRHPHCVVLLDEIEKAHREVHQLLLQVLDEGRLTDGRGRTVDLSHAVIVMTSNLGADQIDPRTRGRLSEDAVLAAAREAFPVELWNRIEAPLVLHPLDEEQMLKICRRLARDSSQRLLRERGIRYALTEAACQHLVRLAGRDTALGARPLRHLLTREVESLIADAVLRGRLRAGTEAMVDLHGKRLAIG